MQFKLPVDEDTPITLQTSHIQSLLYHSYFGYPLDVSELQRWQAGPLVSLPIPSVVKLTVTNDTVAVGDTGRAVIAKLMRRKASSQKFSIARTAAARIAKVPTVLFVGITGSLAMKNANETDDIDLLIITQKGTLWLTRLMVYVLLKLSRTAIRSPKDPDEKDKLCLNMWLDESALVWPHEERSMYSAHEIAQIVPLVNKHKTYERFLWKNKWIRSFWPNAVRILQTRNRGDQKVPVYVRVPELVVYHAQRLYMIRKHTSETVLYNKALFHTQNFEELLQ